MRFRAYAINWALRRDNSGFRVPSKTVSLGELGACDRVKSCVGQPVCALQYGPTVGIALE